MFLMYNIFFTLLNAGQEHNNKFNDFLMIANNIGICAMKDRNTIIKT